MHYVDDPRHGRILVTDHVYDLVVKDRKEACPQRTPGWYKKRNDHVTASMMATVCNANPYESRASALKRKTGLERGFQGNAACDHGNKYELEAIIKYEKRTNSKCLEFGLLESLNDGEHFLAGSPDGITADGRLIEVKCPLRRVPTERVPEMYVYQVQFLMRTLQLDKCDFIQYVPAGVWTTETLIVTRVNYDPFFWQSKFPMLVEFWDEVLAVRAMNEERRRKGLPPRAELESESESSDDGKLVINVPCDKPPLSVQVAEAVACELDPPEEVEKEVCDEEPVLGSTACLPLALVEAVLARQSEAAV